MKWNFTKFLVGRDGTVIKRYEPPVAPPRSRLILSGTSRAGRLPGSSAVSGLQRRIKSVKGEVKP